MCPLLLFNGALGTFEPTAMPQRQSLPQLTLTLTLHTLTLTPIPTIGIVWMMCTMSYLLGVTLVRLIFGFACGMEALTPRGNPSTLQVTSNFQCISSS